MKFHKCIAINSNRKEKFFSKIAKLQVNPIKPNVKGYTKYANCIKNHFFVIENLHKEIFG